MRISDWSSDVCSADLADQVEAIHEASLRVLEEVGMDFLHPEALAILKQAGAAVEAGTNRVRFDRGLVLDRLKTAPARFTLHARNPERSVRMGGNAIVFASIGSAQNVSDLEGGRRIGNFKDYCEIGRA